MSVALPHPRHSPHQKKFKGMLILTKLTRTLSITGFFLLVLSTSIMDFPPNVKHFAWLIRIPLTPDHQASPRPLATTPWKAWGKWLHITPLSLTHQMMIQVLTSSCFLYGRRARRYSRNNSTTPRDSITCESKHCKQHGSKLNGKPLESPRASQMQRESERDQRVRADSDKKAQRERSITPVPMILKWQPSRLGRGEEALSMKAIAKQNRHKRYRTL